MVQFCHLGINEALKGASIMLATLTPDQKAYMLKKARNTIIMSLSDQILRKVIKEKTAAEMWLKLEQLFMSKALPTRIYLKQRFHSFKMDETKSIEENLDDFMKFVSDLENLEIEVDD